MFQDMMRQLGSLLSVLAKFNDKRSTASSRETGYINTDDITNGEMSEPSEETNTSRKPIFEVSEPMQAFFQLASCRPWSACNKTRTMWIEWLSVPEGYETCCPKFDSIFKSELPKEAPEINRKLSLLQNFYLICCWSTHCSEGGAESAGGTGVRHCSVNDTTGLHLHRNCIGSFYS